MKRRSIGLRLTLGIVLVGVAVALAVGWQILVVADLRPVAAGLTSVHWLLLILGGLFFLLLIVGLLLICVWLVGEIRFNQRQQAFLDAVTHEMKTPLAALRLYLETLGRHEIPAERRRDFLRR
jgi:signal transduction histidine kinase